MKNSKPNVVVFDLGGVLIDWNPNYLYERMFNGDQEKKDYFLSEVCNYDWNAKQDAGRSFADGVAEAKAQFPQYTEYIEAYDSRWEEMIGGQFDGTVAIVEELHAKCVPLYVLSNFSRDKIKLMYQRFRYFENFDKLFISGELGLIKPDAAIFEHLLKESSRKAEECLFVDDLEKNTRSAADLGFQVHTFVSPELLREDLVQRGVL